MNEIERFEKKACDYRKALQRSPKARLLELYPILQLLHAHAVATSKPVASLKIVDLMSGSGFLAENLHKAGFHNLHAVEFCGAMCEDAPIYAEKVRLHRIKDFSHLHSYLESIVPDVIISLASFHHLLRYANSNIVDPIGSRKLQKSVIDICMQSLPQSGLVVIADLIEEDVPETIFPDGMRSMRQTMNDLVTLGVPQAIIGPLRKCRTIQGTSSTVAREYAAKVGSVSLDWFRNHVAQKTSVGHKDAAISLELCDLIASYKPCVAKYSCPWMFDSADERNAFVHFKFGFALDANTERYMTPAAVGTAAETVLGLKNVQGNSFLGWNLGIVAIWRSNPFDSSRRYQRLVSSLSILIALLIGALVLRGVADVYVTPSWTGLLIFVITMPIGVIFGDMLQSWSSRSRG